MEFVSLKDAEPCRSPEEFGAWVRGVALLSEQVLDYLQQFKPLGGFQRSALVLLVQHARFLSEDSSYIADILTENPEVMQGDPELELQEEGAKNA